MNILLIEDDPDLRGILVFALTDEGHHVVASPGHHGVFEVLRELPFDLVLSDVDTERANGGIEFARVAQYSHPELPVVLMTGGPVHIVRDATGRACLQKPFEIDELLTTLARATKKA